MIEITFPDPDFLVQKKEGKTLIFDEIRKKYVVLTPEEWVRQNMIRYLIRIKHFPPTLMSIEKEIMLGTLKKRYDLVIYNRDSLPWMMVECKSLDIPISDKTLEQILRYHQVLAVHYLVLTNGKQTYCMGRSGPYQNFEFLPDLPEFPRS
ncbi:MAG: type I restriction enzyme HsdR N-terminal domain-containing protein [Chitinophagaceae bacterium]